MADVAFKALSFLRSNIASALSGPIEQFLTRNPQARERAVKFGESLHAFESRAAEAKQASAALPGGQVNGIEHLAANISKGLVDAVAICILLNELARQRRMAAAATQRPSDLGSFEEVNRNLEYVKGELDDMRKLLKQQEQLLAADQQRDGLSQKTV